MDGANSSNVTLFCPTVTESFPLSYAILAALYCAVGVASVLGNLIVVAIVFTKKEMMTVTNLFVCNLALSDFIVCSTSLWMTPLNSYSRIWSLGKFMCYFAQFSPALTIFVSTYTLVGIAVDRYILVMHPMTRKMSNCQFAINLTAIWMASGLLALPLLFHTEYHSFEGCGQAFCLETGWEPTTSRFVYGIVVLVAKTVVPFSCISFCYTRISLRLKRQTQRFSGRNLIDENTVETSALIKSRKLNRILVAMVVLFGVCSLPLDALNLYRDSQFVFELKLISRETLKIAGMICHLVAMSATLLNPVMYAWWNENFKREIQRRATCPHTEFVVTFQSRPNMKVSVERKNRGSSIRSRGNNPLELNRLLQNNSTEDQLSTKVTRNHQSSNSLLD